MAPAGPPAVLSFQKWAHASHFARSEVQISHSKHFSAKESGQNSAHTFLPKELAAPQKNPFSGPGKNHFYISHFPAGLLPKLVNEKEKNKKRPPKAKEKIIKKTRIEVAQQKNAAKLQKKECRPGRRSRPQSAIGEEGKNDRRWIEPPGQ
jgi:hypothetical protein